MEGDVREEWGVRSNEANATVSYGITSQRHSALFRPLLRFSVVDGRERFFVSKSISRSALALPPNKDEGDSPHQTISSPPRANYHK